MRDRNTHTGRHARPVTDDYFPASLAPPPRWHCYSPFASAPRGKSLPVCLLSLFSSSPFFYNPLGLLSLFPSPPPYLSLSSYSSSSFCYTFFSLCLPLRSASFAALARSEESPAKSCCVLLSASREACAASSSLTGSLSLSLHPTLSQKQHHSFSPLHSPCLSIFSSSSSVTAIFVSSSLVLLKLKQKWRLPPR